jgi:hypothetical protein
MGRLAPCVGYDDDVMRSVSVSVAIAAASAVIGLAAGCSSFTAADSGPGPGGGDASVDGPGVDGGASSGGDGGPCPAPIDDAFADYGEWKPQTAGSIDPDAGDPAPSLYVTRPPGAPGRYLRRTLDPGACTKVTVSVKLRIDALGDGEIDMFGLYDNGSPRTVLLTHHDGAVTALVAEADNYDPGGTTVVTADSAWHRVTLTLDLAKGDWTMTGDNKNATGGSLGAAWSGPPDVRVGLDWDQTTVNIGWRVHYDSFHAEFSP